MAMKLKEPTRVGSFYVKIAPSSLSLRTAGATFEPMYACQMDFIGSFKEATIGHWALLKSGYAVYPLT